MLLKVVVGDGEWLLLNGTCHLIHLKHLIQRKCKSWPETATALDLCDIETGTLMGFHTLEPWDMATSCFEDMNTQRKIFIPVAMTIEKDVIRAIEPMLMQFDEQFPESKAILDSLINTKIRVQSSKAAKTPVLQQTGVKDSKVKAKSSKKTKEKKTAKK